MPRIATIIKLPCTALLWPPRRLLTLKENVKKGKKTRKYFYFVDIGIDSLTGKKEAGIH